VCLQGLPVTFALDRGGIVGEDGPTHHGLFDLSYLRHIPNMVLMAPKDEAELQRMLATGVGLGGPCALRYPRGAGLGVELCQGAITPLRLGECEVLREGDDVLILAVGACVQPAMEASLILEEHGLQATVVNARFVKPLDKNRIMPLALRIGKVITVEENVLAGGFGSAVLEMLHECDAADHQVKVKRLGIQDVFVEHGTQEELRLRHGLDAQSIAQTALQWLEAPSVVALQRKGLAG